MWNFRVEEEARLKQFQELVEGCKNHPAYRYKRKPTEKCKRCEELYSFAVQLKEWDEKSQEWWKTYHAAHAKEQQIESDRREAWINSPG